MLALVLMHVHVLPDGSLSEPPFDAPGICSFQSYRVLPGMTIARVWKERLKFTVAKDTYIGKQAKLDLKLVISRAHAQESYISCQHWLAWKAWTQTHLHHGILTCYSATLKGFREGPLDQCRHIGDL